MCLCITEALCYTPERNSAVNQLDFRLEKVTQERTGADYSDCGRLQPPANYLTTPALQAVDATMCGLERLRLLPQRVPRVSAQGCQEQSQGADYDESPGMRGAGKPPVLTPAGAGWNPRRMWGPPRGPFTPASSSGEWGLGWGHREAFQRRHWGSC